jgi:beta-glucanase (GH16 family)
MAKLALVLVVILLYMAVTNDTEAQVACPTPTPTVSVPTPTPVIPTPTPTPTATPSGYLFQDEFTTSIDTSKWSVLNRFGDTSNNERECYKPSQASIYNSFLLITSEVDGTCSGGYKSAMLQWTSFNFLYGRIDVRAATDDAGGQWPAIWLLGTNCQAGNIIDANPGGACSWPQSGSDEIDIAEWLGGNMSVVNQQIHTASSNFGCQPTVSPSAAGNWHVYSLDWRAGSMSWLIDGVVKCTLTGSQVPNTAKFLILNQAVGGAGGNVNPAAFPAYFAVDYVRVSP